VRAGWFLTPTIVKKTRQVLTEDIAKIDPEKILLLSNDGDDFLVGQDGQHASPLESPAMLSFFQNLYGEE